MISQSAPSGTAAVRTPSGICFTQTENTNPVWQKQENLKKHLKAEIKVIGTIQIMCGLMVLSIGIILGSSPYSPHFTSVFSVLLKSSYPFTGGLIFVICGSLSIITEKKTNKPLVNSSLVISILSAVWALIGLILISISLATLGPALRQCELDQQSKPDSQRYYYRYSGSGDRNCLPVKDTLTGVLTVMVICTMLESCLSALTAALWWKQACSDFLGTVVFLPQSNRNTSNTSAKILCNPEYEELST